MDDEVGNIISELQAPLAAIAMDAGTLESSVDRDASPAKDAVERINAIVARMHRTIEDLIDLRAIDVGAFQIVRTPAQLRDLVDAALRRFSLADRERIVIECPQPLSVFVDQRRIERVIAQLVHVGLATSRRDSTLTVRAEHQQRRAVVTVMTTATIEATIVRGLFDADAAGQHGHHADRLGVAVGRFTVEAHGGALLVVEVPRGGHRFVLELPLPSRPARRDPRMALGSSVLIVDDQADQVAALATLLRSDGIGADVATCGAEALACIEVHVPDVLVIDAHVIDMDAAELIRRARETHPELPAVLLTGYPSDHPAIAAAIEATDGAYVAKPVDISVLYQQLVRAVQRSERSLCPK